MADIKLEKLDVGYDNKTVIKDICLKVNAGEIVALIGPNGVGKSTVLKTVSGMLAPKAGKVYLAAQDIGELNNTEIAKSMAVMLTNRVNTEYITSFDVVGVGRYQYTGIMGKLSDDDVKKIDEALHSVGAWNFRNKDFTKLSDGQKQRVLLARALVQEPKIMILDEPTSFLDIGYKLEFVENLRRLAKEKNIGVLLSMHELEMAYKLADTVVCLSDEGIVEKIGTPSEVFEKTYIEKLFHIPAGKIGNLYGFLKNINPVAQIEARFENKGTRFLMVQGTMSSAGKSLIVAGLCRIFKQDGYRVAPFKSQNMALNSFITEDGLEMGRAQVMQAEAAGIKPSVYMNPILLKPTDDSGSQIIVNGRVVGNMRARDYFKYKKELVPDILHAVEELSKQADIIVIEGAGSPAEINLKQNDIVNMGMAKMVDAPVLLVGDIDRGGVFAQLLGTIELLDDDERERIKGLIVNKFRGDKTILDPGIEMLEERGNIPVAGVIPYMYLQLDDEDSLTERFDRKKDAAVKIGVVKVPHISNFTDFDVFDQVRGVAVHYVTTPGEIEKMDALILPGSKNTIYDMKWLKETGIESAIKKFSAKGKVLFGICGGYQMLGDRITDPLKVEAGGEITGLGLLPVVTKLTSSKQTVQVSGKILNSSGILEKMEDLNFTGYEIHMGETSIRNGSEDAVKEFTDRQTGYCMNNIYGTYVHGFFDDKKVVKTFVQSIADSKGVSLELDTVEDYKTIKEREYDRLADTMREYMNMNLIYEMIGIKR